LVVVVEAEGVDFLEEKSAGEKERIAWEREREKRP
jgi:hypothetical protein